MTERIITLTEAEHLLADLHKHPLQEILIVAHDDQPLLALMPYDLHREILANLASLQNVLEVMASGIQSELPRTPRPERVLPTAEKSTSWEEFKAEVGWE